MGPITPPTNRILPWRDQNLHAIAASLGNPHIVLFQPPVPFHQAAKELSTHPSLKDGANVSFVTPSEENTFHVQVWERGVGPTLACGTAACAVAASAVHERLARPNQPILIHLPGGILQVTITPDHHAILTGPARHVFDGRLMPL
jgi:diaminopimelate epimerase